MKIEAQPCGTLEICIHPPNVLHEYQCNIENVWFYTNPRYMFTLLNGKDKAVSLYFHNYSLDNNLDVSLKYNNGG